MLEQSEVVDEVPVKNGKNADTVRLVAKDDVTAIVPVGLDKSTVIIKVQNKPEEIKAPVKKGDEICTADIIYGDQVVATTTLVAADDVELSTLLKVLNSIKAFFSLTAVKIVIAVVVIGLAAYITLAVSNAKKRKARRRKALEERENDE